MQKLKRQLHKQWCQYSIRKLQFIARSRPRYFRYFYKLREPLESSPEEKDFKVLVDERLYMGSSVLLWSRRQKLSRVASREARQTVQWRWFFPSTLSSWDPTWSTACSFEAYHVRRTWICWSRFRGAPQGWWEGWSISPVWTGWECWGSTAWRRKDSGGTL